MSESKIRREPTASTPKRGKAKRKAREWWAYLCAHGLIEDSNYGAIMMLDDAGATCAVCELPVVRVREVLPAKPRKGRKP